MAHLPRSLCRSDWWWVSTAMFGPPCTWGFAAGWVGLWVVFGHANPVAITTAAAVALAVHLFVVFYEEPTLRKKFGADYEEYRRNVGRWWPRVRGWDKPQ